VAEYEKKVRKKLTEYGCSFKRRGKGDHDIWQVLNIIFKEVHRCIHS